MAQALKAQERFRTVEGKAGDMAETLREDMAEMKDTVSRKATELVETAGAKLKAVGVDPEAMVATAKDKTHAVQKALQDELKAHPLRTIGIAAALGLVVGLLTRR
jgi:ElaB/YqjD/DUF883 family membrane-anchored ribosome-binding protein